MKELKVIVTGRTQNGGMVAVEEIVWSNNSDREIINGILSDMTSQVQDIVQIVSIVIVNT